MKRFLPPLFGIVAVLVGISCVVFAVLFAEIKQDRNFSLERSSCPAALAPGEECQIYVAFHPQQEGDVSGTLEITTSAGKKTFSLSGTGFARGAKAALSRGEGQSKSKTSLDIGQRSLQLYTLQNSGSKDLVVKRAPSVANTAQGVWWVYLSILAGIMLVALGAIVLFFVATRRSA